ncbi:hypothetical protein JHN63_15060 [Streptomyces sp. MBT65]|uniref:hypothetical protein n=1 Tax=Streptomyces sp. MBT65 TaxID=1488395 RepID=UPI00190A2822|nr:hypothetical protein [Streptomyces sp. MBT65]MBK3575107.1 hypothetical protein [Streptomyces sp. MBT65]
MRNTAGRTALITLALRDLIPGADLAHMTVQVAERFPDSVALKNTWSGTPDGVARKIAAAVWGDTGQDASPLDQAADARRARDLVAEASILMSAGADLEAAPWYPVRPGDLVHIAYEQAGEMAAFGETYLVYDAGRGLLGMSLLTHNLPATVDDDVAAGMTGVFASEDSDDPLYDLWFEAGPQRLTIVRDGRPVHIGGAR